MSGRPRRAVRRRPSGRELRRLANSVAIGYNNIRYMNRRDIDRQLPLPPAFLHILIAIGDGERHGYAIMQAVADRTSGKVRMSPGTLYGSIRRLLDDGLIEEVMRRPSRGDDDERRRYYRVTPFGRAVATAETVRLSTLVQDARAAGLVLRKG
jgi:DNA-binding PadR family transcriptional regulator